MRKRAARREAMLLCIGLASVAILCWARKSVAALATDPFLWAAAAQACLCAAGAALVWKGKSSPATFWIVIIVAALLRLGLLAQSPTRSDDIHRYIWDGRVQAAGINPYRYIPADRISPSCATIRFIRRPIGGITRPRFIRRARKCFSSRSRE